MFNDMIPKNVLNIEKKEYVIGNVFHLFYINLAESILFDSDLSMPIIWGNKSIVFTQLKNINEILKVDKKTKVVIVSYIPSYRGYKLYDMYNGPIAGVGKYVKRY